MTYFFSMLRFVPDPARGEFVNIGAIAGDEETQDWELRLISNLKRARSIDHVAFLPHALEVAAELRERGARLALVVSDQRMPGMTGIETVMRMPDASGFLGLMPGHIDADGGRDGTWLGARPTWPQPADGADHHGRRRLLGLRRRPFGAGAAPAFQPVARRAEPDAAGRRDAAARAAIPVRGLHAVSTPENALKQAIITVTQEEIFKKLESPSSA